MKQISGKKLAKILEHLGWKLVDVEGSHFKYRKGERTAIIPIHANRDLRIGTLKSIMKAAGLTEADLL